jgi:hypothetical protein
MRAVLAERAGTGATVVPEGPNPIAEPFAIGDLVLENRLVQAPLAGTATGPG